MSPKLVQFDWAIKTLLRKKINFPILEGFLSELLHKDVKIETLLESESNPEYEYDKANRVDILAELTGGEKVIIEVQCLREWDFLSRMLYGVSKVVVEYLNKGERFGKISKVISVNIIYFDLGKGKDYIYHGRTQLEGVRYHDFLELGKKEREQYPTRIKSVEDIFPEYYLLKIKQFDDQIRDTLDEWVYTLRESQVKSNFHAKGLQEAAEQLDVMRLSEEERRGYERYVDNLRIENSVSDTYYGDGLRDGMKKGLKEDLKEDLKEGLEQGRQQGAERAAQEKKAMILKMAEQGVTLDQITLISQLSKAEVAAIIEP